jgi:hypothetical protein
MDCKHIQDLLPAFEEKLLAAHDMAAVQAHLSGCVQCQKELVQLSAAWNLLEVLEPVTPSPEFRVRFWEKARQEEKASWLAFPRLIPAMAGFLGIWVAGVGLGAFFFMHSKPTTAMTRPAVWSEASLTDAYMRRLGHV